MGAPQQQDLLACTLGLADDALVLGHRLSEWCGKGPMLEEDIALANLALDHIGQARLFYAYAGEIEGHLKGTPGRSEDEFAYFRDDREFCNLLLVEQPNGDFATTIVRQLLYAAFMQPYYQELTRSSDARLAEIAAKAVKEMAYHVRHASEWIIRLGDGTATSHARTAEALDALWMYTGELFDMTDGERALAAAGVVPDRGLMRPAWQATLARVLADATLEMPGDRHMQGGGRRGRHGELFGKMLAEMQVLARAHPGVTW